MDEDDSNGLIQRCQKLKQKFRGVLAADIFPSKLKSNTFLMVNESKSQSPGTHWLLICKKNEQILFADPLDLGLLKRIFINDLQKIMHSFTNYLKTNQFKVKTQICADSLVFLLLI